MTRRPLTDLSLLFALESCDAALDEDEAFRLADIARELRDRADRLSVVRAVADTKAPRVGA